MERLFTDPSKRIYALYGNTGDYLCTPQLRELDLSSWLLAHLKSLGYRRVVYYSPRKKIHFLDAESARLAHGDPNAMEPSVSRPGSGAAVGKIKAGPLGLARLPRTRPNSAPDSAPAEPSRSDADIRWDLGAMNDAQAISALDRMLCEPLPTALIFQNGEDLLDKLDADAVRHWDDAFGDWGGTRLPSTSRNLAALIFRDAIDLSADRLPRLGKLLLVGDPARPSGDRTFRVGPARQDEVANLLHRLRLRGDIGWTPAQIARHSLGLAQRLIPDTISDGVKSLGTLSHEVRAMSAPPASDQDPWTQLRRAPGLAARVEQPLQALVNNAREKLARHATPSMARGPLDIERLTIQQRPAADRLANLHLALLGSPGTGKTTLARWVARIYRDEGILTSGHLVEVSASQLIEEHIGGTAKRTAEAVSRALGGVLFIDEAYSLSSNQFGAEAVTELVQAMTQYNGQFAVIIAGYTEQINDFIEGPDANPGLRRRFPVDNRWTLTNYDPSELYAIFCHLLTQEEREQDEELQAELPGAFVQWHKAQDPKSFGNAGEVKNLVDTLARAAGERRLIGKHDFAALPGWRQSLGLQPLPSVAELLRPLDKMVGLEGVRDKLEAMCHTLHMAMRRTGSLAGHAPGHYLFTGNPGTGKTTVARIMGAMLYELGLLNKGHLHELSAHRLVGEHVGDAEKTMREALRCAQDGVLFIDEAHQLALQGHQQGQSALRVLVPEMENRRQQLCVILAGYPNELKQLLATDPGLLSRCQEIAFADYTAPELHEIAVRMLAEREMQLSEGASEQLLRLLAYLYAKRDEHFGNARDVRNLIDREILPSQARRLQADLGIPRGDPRLSTIECEDIPGRADFDPAQWDDAVTGRGITDIARVLAELDGLVGLAPVKTAIRSLTDTLAVQQRRGRGTLAPGHYAFSGNPGTGKTTVARIMGDVFRALGLLARGHVEEVKREDLVGRYQGDAENNMKERIAAALDGVLFVDEAYQLAADEHDIYGRRALETLLASMENHRDRLCVILAGYPNEMQRLLSTNPGFKRRINNMIDFPDYSSEELLAIARGELAKQDFHLTEEATAALAAHLQSWDTRRGRADFGNAGDVRNLVGAIIMRQSGRLRPRIDQVTDEELSSIIEEDVPK
ncbi:Protein CfxQ (modular protein) [Thiocapsa sp. KS1]|nr:AAA family ATPase [Thiocapsa sp. KS1]CRI67787.1 Protein CfxQ (modular protein) [Thiocapsa sp. KS1]